MKESTLKEILSKPVIDSAMDQRITNVLLSYDENAVLNERSKSADKRYHFAHKVFSYGIAKIAIVVLVLSVVGVGTVWATDLFKVKSNHYQVKLLSPEEYEEAGYIPFNFEQDRIRKEFGKGINELWGPNNDVNGNVLVLDEEGYYDYGNGVRIPAMYIPDPERYEKARTSGGKAFAEIKYPDLIPTYIYDNYILHPDGFVYTEYLDDSFKKIAARFVKDSYEYGGDFHEEIIWIEFMPRDKDVVISGGLRVVEDKDNYIFSQYTTRGGILCHITQYNDSDNILVHIDFESDTIGNGSMMIDFQGIEWGKVTEILDTLPLTAENVDSYINE